MARQLRTAAIVSSDSALMQLDDAERRKTKQMQMASAACATVAVGLGGYALYAGDKSRVLTAGSVGLTGAAIWLWWKAAPWVFHATPGAAAPDLTPADVQDALARNRASVHTSGVGAGQAALYWAQLRR